MKKLLLSISIALISGMVFGQFGGGIGSESDPYRIYTKAHLEELSDSLNLLNIFTGKHFRLMNNIEDSLAIRLDVYGAGSFDGSFHGSGYTITVNIDYDSECALFYSLSENGYLDSLTLVGNLSYPTGFCVNNYGGTIYNCINSTTNKTSLDSIGEYSSYSGICFYNGGKIISCINNSNLYGNQFAGGICYWSTGDYGSLTPNKGIIDNCINNGNIEMLFGYVAGIVYDATATEISNCINKGNISQTFVTLELCGNIGGICGRYGILINDDVSKIVNCQNFGNVFAKSAPVCGGIVAFIDENGIVVNCSNYGNIFGENNVGGIYGRISGYIFKESIDDNRVVKNCFNSGSVIGETYTGGIGGVISDSPLDTLTNCLNIAHINKPAVAGNDDGLEVNPLIIINNFYDKQMCLSKGIGDADVPNSAEGKLTTQLTGTSPELQMMLGTGWSYAEGRYPIPLGLENDSMALVAATPVYLHFETEEAYNHVDSVSKNFTVGLENNVTWDEANGRVSFSDENVTLLSLGIENLTVSLGDYSKKVRINILDTEVSTTHQSIENGISVYPNPAGDYVNLSLNGVKADKVEIYDITGKIISSQLLATEHNQIHIENLKPGMYLLKIYNKNQNVTTLRFAKR